MMISMIRVCKSVLAASAVISLLAVPQVVLANNDVLGEIQFEGTGAGAKTSGVWIDGQYVGFLKELKGSRKVVLLPGKHEIVLRQAGYKDFSQSVLVEPGQKHVVRVAMEKDPEARYPEVTAQVKISVLPKRAAVFVDDRFVGHVGEFDGARQALLLAPGKHRIKITLPGYQTFETEVEALANQKFELRTELLKGTILQAGPLIRAEGRAPQE